MQTWTCCQILKGELKPHRQITTMIALHSYSPFYAITTKSWDQHAALLFNSMLNLSVHMNNHRNGDDSGYHDFQSLQMKTYHSTTCWLYIGTAYNLTLDKKMLRMMM